LIDVTSGEILIAYYDSVKLTKDLTSLVGKEWVEEKVMNEQHNISPKDMDIFHIVDTTDEAINVINEFYKKYEHKPNF
jgi:predicted Rossmann-fold nucleotide-binding protein